MSAALLLPGLLHLTLGDDEMMFWGILLYSFLAHSDTWTIGLLLLLGVRIFTEATRKLHFYFPAEKKQL